MLRVKAGEQRDRERCGETERKTDTKREEDGEREKETFRRKKEQHRGKSGATPTFHSHPSAPRGELSGVVSRRNTHKSSMQQPRQLKPVHSCQTAPSAPVSLGMRTAGAPLSKVQLGDQPAVGREGGE